MNEIYHFADFGDLYRATFAEPNPATKQLLLAEVKKALDHWAQTINEAMPVSALLLVHQSTRAAECHFGLPPDLDTTVPPYYTRSIPAPVSANLNLGTHRGAILIGLVSSTANALRTRL